MNDIEYSILEAASNLHIINERDPPRNLSDDLTNSVRSISKKGRKKNKKRDKKNSKPDYDSENAFDDMITGRNANKSDPNDQKSDTNSGEKSDDSKNDNKPEGDKSSEDNNDDSQNDEQPQEDDQSETDTSPEPPKKLSGYTLVSNYEIEDASHRFSTKGKVLKSCWLIGPSQATLSNNTPVIFDPYKIGNNGSDAKNSEENGNKNEPSDSESSDNTESNSSSSEDSDKDNESFQYSIFEACMNLHAVYEADDQSQENQSSEDKSSDKPSDNKSDNSDKEKSDGDTPQEENNSFELGTTIELSVGIKDEGFTVWTIALDSHADVNAVKSAIKSKKFKLAYQIASKDIQSDGLVPLRAATYVKDDVAIPPPFIGHCKFGFDAGEADDYRDEGGNTSGYTITLAMAPIIGETNKPSTSVVVQAVYNVTGDITGGKLGQLFAAASKKIGDKIKGKDSDRYSRYNDDEDKDSEKSKVEILSKFIHNSFKTVGDHTMYKDYMKIRKFISDNIKKKFLELEDVTKMSINSMSGMFKPKGHLLYF